MKIGDDVKVFLLAKGVECESVDTNKFKVSEQVRQMVNSNGKIFACGTCLKVRGSSGSEACPLSTMQDMYDLVRDCDKVLTF